MGSRCFFGHGKGVGVDNVKLKRAILEAIDGGIRIFYVGNNGDFDSLVAKTMSEIQKEFPPVRWFIVTAYIDDAETIPYGNAIYPEGLELTPKRYCIDKRNRWMIDRSDVVITYVARPFGNAEKYKRIAEKKGKTVLNLI